jgi:hypothetical protein
LFTPPSTINSTATPSQNFNLYSVSQTASIPLQSNPTYVNPFGGDASQTSTSNAWQQTQTAAGLGGGVRLVGLQRRSGSDSEFGFMDSGKSKDSFDFVNDILK